MPIKLKSTGGGSVSLTPPSTAADLVVTLPSVSSTLLTSADFGALVNYVDDAAAATGGVAVGGLYRTASAIKMRVA